MHADLDALQAQQLPKCQWRDFLKLENELEPCFTAFATVADRQWAQYFSHFVKPNPDGTCIGCGQRLAGGGLDTAFAMTTFRWGLAYGEGHCANCGYPARAFHRDIGPIKFLNCILQYHPDELKSEPTTEDRGE